MNSEEHLIFLITARYRINQSSRLDTRPGTLVGDLLNITRNVLDRNREQTIRPDRSLRRGSFALQPFLA